VENDYWESGLDARFGRDIYDSFVRYQARLIRVFDRLAKPYGFEVVDAGRPAEEVSRRSSRPSPACSRALLSRAQNGLRLAVLEHLVRRALYQQQDNGGCQALHEGRRVVRQEEGRDGQNHGEVERNLDPGAKTLPQGYFVGYDRHGVPAHVAGDLIVF
jgi:hypothetical protein